MAKRLQYLPATHRYSHVLVLPCYDELDLDLQKLLPPSYPHKPGPTSGDQAKLLVILVINAPDNAPRPAQRRTQDHLRQLQAQLNQPQQLSDSAILGDLSATIAALVLDCCSTPAHCIPQRQGVGKARKLGADCALALIAANRIQVPWIYCTDADAQLPDGYFQSLAPAAATLFAFAHHSNEPQRQRRAELYERHLDLYVSRLRAAHSPYAFHTLGSTMVLHADHYAQVRGFPKRNAGEDFHLLNKLAKTGAINQLNEPVIRLSARLSHRVPFGTGPALAELTGDEASYSTYANESFGLVGQVMVGFQRLSQDIAPAWSEPTAEILEQMDFTTRQRVLWRHARQPETRLKALHDWFDGLKTLRFIHYAQRFHPDVPIREIT